MFLMAINGQWMFTHPSLSEHGKENQTPRQHLSSRKGNQEVWRGIVSRGEVVPVTVINNNSKEVGEGRH